MKKKIMIAIGARLKDARSAARLTQEDVSTHFLCSRQTISSWENGHTLPNLHEFRELASLYGESADFLLYGVRVGEVADSLFDRLRPAAPRREVEGTLTGA